MRIGGLAADAHAEKYGTIFQPGNVVDLLCKIILTAFFKVKKMILNLYILNRRSKWN